jgi:hypothetical protein
MKKFVTCFAASMAITVPAFGQMLVPMTPTQYLGSQALGAVGNLALAVGELARANREIDEQLAAARQAYFAAPSGPARAKLAGKFDEAMMKRDLHYVAMRIINGVKRDAPLFAATFAMGGSNAVDGGISPYSRGTYVVWADAVINGASQYGELSKALRDAKPQFDKYRVERDIVEELFHNPNSVLRGENTKPSEYLAGWILGTKNATTFETANAAAAKIVRTVGPTRLDEIVQVLRSWSVVDDHVHGPSGGDLATALDPLVTGSAAAPAGVDFSSHRAEFIEFRGDLSQSNPRLVPQFDELERAWNEGRASKDIDALRQAVSKRDELSEGIQSAQRARGFGMDDTAKLLLSRLDNSFAFLDHGVQGAELAAMSRGEMRRAAESAQPTAVVADATAAGARRGAAAARRVTQASASGSASVERAAVAPAASPAMAASSASGDDSPFDRAVAIADELSARDPDARYHTFELAKQWDYISGSSMDPQTKRMAYGQLKSGVGQQIENQKRDLNQDVQTLASFSQADRPRFEPVFTFKIERRKALIAELEAAVPRIEKAIAANE